MGIPIHMRHLFMDTAEQQFGIYPENDSPVGLFMGMLTQLLTGSAGMAGMVPVGINYAVLGDVMRWRGIPAEQHAEHFECVQIMEGAWLDELAKQRKQRSRA